MDLFKRNRLSADFIAPPAEPSGEAMIGQLDDKALIARRSGNLAEMNRLLDLRNAIRPGRPAEVPVIPGRTT